MTKETWKGITVLRAENGGYLTNSVIYTDSVYLGKDMDQSIWRDATREEYEEWQRNPSEDVPTSEEIVDILLGLSEGGAE